MIFLEFANEQASATVGASVTGNVAIALKVSFAAIDCKHFGTDLPTLPL